MVRNTSSCFYFCGLTSGRIGVCIKNFIVKVHAFEPGLPMFRHCVSFSFVATV